jgi:hypothetical protein
MQNPTHSNHLIRRSAQWLFLLNTIVWLALSAGALVQRANRGLSAGIWLLVALMAGNAAAMAACAWGLGLRKKTFDLFALLVLAVNIMLTFTDQFGLLDLLTLLLDLVLFMLVIASLFAKPKTIVG